MLVFATNPVPFIFQFMIRAIVFDLDNTLVDFMAMKRQAIEAAIDAMLDAGLELERSEIKTRIDAIYKERGIEYQQVFDDLIFGILNEVNHRILSAGVIAYFGAREAALKLYPHVTATLMQLLRRGIKLAVLTDAPSREAWLRRSWNRAPRTAVARRLQRSGPARA